MSGGVWHCFCDSLRLVSGCLMRETRCLWQAGNAEVDVDRPDCNYHRYFFLLSEHATYCFLLDFVLLENDSEVVTYWGEISTEGYLRLFVY